MSRTFSTELECGCVVADMEQDGWEGIAGCCAEYGDMKKKKDQDKLKLHEKCIKKYFQEKTKQTKERCPKCGSTNTKTKTINKSFTTKQCKDCTNIWWI